MKAKKKQITKRIANERKTNSANEEAETKTIKQWLRILDKPRDVEKDK